MKNANGEFRFAYFSAKYEETIKFYEQKLGFSINHSWDRNELDKGTVFKAGAGLIEVLKLPNKKELENAGLDYRNPQGAFMVIQAFNIDERYEKYKALDISFKQEITNQSWGHRSFSVVEPNGLVLFFFQEQ